MSQGLGPLQRAWIDALRSGEFKQGMDTLCNRKNDDGAEWEYCCLGVACETLRRHGVAMDVAELPLCDEQLVRRYGNAGAFKTFCVPDAVRDAMALRSDAGSIEYGEARDDIVAFLGGAPDDLAIINDEMGFSFSRIAEFCERWPEAVFSGPA